MIVEVYRNLRKKCFSVRDAKTKRVIAHKTTVYLRNATFHVSAAGRKRVRATGQKNVHAFIRGTITIFAIIEQEMDTRLNTRVDRVMYDPYKQVSFETQWESRPIRAADFVECLHGYDVWAHNKCQTKNLGKKKLTRRK